MAEQIQATLAERLRSRIRLHGPITFREWMTAALYDEKEGYYCRSNPQRWGRTGDYRTSPERSVLFAATFAHYFAQLYRELGAPPSWTILEVGAGEGSFAIGLLETLRRSFPHEFSKTQYIIDEVSAHSRAQAENRLRGFVRSLSCRRLSELESICNGVIFANEVLDAFPVHRVVRRGGRLRELYVDVNREGDFVWAEGPLSSPRLSDFFEVRGIQLVEDQTVELNLTIEDWLRMVSDKLRRGFLIIVDYGAESSQLYASGERREGTLRAFSHHQFAAPLTHPGEQDLTTTVDWTFVRHIAENLGFTVVEFERQDQFLLNNGILEELQLQTSKAEAESVRAELSTSAREMILPGGMGESFQVLVLRKS